MDSNSSTAASTASGSLGAGGLHPTPAAAERAGSRRRSTRVEILDLPLEVRSRELASIRAGRATGVSAHAAVVPEPPLGQHVVEAGAGPGADQGPLR
jgi:hypothetical protein